MEKERKVKKIIVILAILLIIILTITYYVFKENERKKNTEEYYANKEYNSKEDFNTVEEVLVFKGVKFIKQTKSSDDKYIADIYVKLNQPLYTEEEDNEQFYTNMIVLLAYVQKYNNFRVIDEENEITLSVFCNSKQQTVTTIAVNGVTNYWNIKRRETAIAQIEGVIKTDLNIQSDEINKLIMNEWRRNKLDIEVQKNKTGTYEIFTEKGLEIRTVYKKVFNIVFTKQYNKSVVNNIKPGTDLNKIEEILGKPIYGSSTIGIMGYKSSEIYIFFTQEDISVYRVEKEYQNLEDFFTLIEKFERDKNIKDFVNGVTDIWPDYDIYDWGTNYIDLRYTLKGIKIQFNVSNANGMIYDNNYTAEIRKGLTVQDIKNDISKLPKYTHFEEEGGIWEIETQRYYDKTEIEEGYEE